MDTLLPFALLCFTSFFTLTNPLGTMPVFLTMTKGMDDEERRHIGSPDKPGGLSIQLCKSEKKEFYIRYSS